MRTTASSRSMPHASPRWIHIVSYEMRSTWRRCNRCNASTDGGSTSSPSRRWNATAGPLATKVLIGLNVVTYLATAAGGGAGGRGGDLQSRLSLYGPAVARGEWYRLISSGFVHYGLIHIGFNMLLLYQLGLMLEPALGRTRFLALYFAALLTGSFAALLLSPAVVSGGASGAVF